MPPPPQGGPNSHKAEELLKQPDYSEKIKALLGNLQGQPGGQRGGRQWGGGRRWCPMGASLGGGHQCYPMGVSLGGASLGGGISLSEGGDNGGG